MGFAIFFGCMMIIGVLFVKYYSLDELDPEVTYGDAFNEGLGVSFSGFLLSWIVFYSWIYGA